MEELTRGRGRPRMYTKMHGVLVRMEDTLYQELKKWADRDGIAVNTLIQRELARAVLTKAPDPSVSTGTNA